MAKIIGIDLGTTYSAVSIWDEKRQAAVIIPNLSGSPTTPSVVSVNEAGEVIVGEEAKRNFVNNPENTVSQIKREMGTDFSVTFQGQPYNPQTISAFILRYLKVCAEKYLGESIYDAVITVPAFFKEVQKTATRDAGIIAGLNVHRLINEPTAAAIAYGVDKSEQGSRIYGVYDLGGGTFDVSIIEITPSDITVIGTGGDSRLGGLDMDEEVMKWALREIKKKHGVDLGGDETVKRRLKAEAEGIKKSLVVAETATLQAPFLTMVNGQPLNVSLQITRRQFEDLILRLLKRSLECLDVAVGSAAEKNQVGWEDLDGILLVGGPTRLHKIQDMLRDKLREHVPDKEPVIRADLNPDEVVAMGAAIVAAGLTPIGQPPEEIENLAPEQVEAIKEEQRTEGGVVNAPVPDIYDVTGHSLGMAVQGSQMHVIIPKETIIPISITEQGFSNAADFTTELVVQVYQGEEQFVAANTKVGEVRIAGLDPLPAGHHVLEVTFTLDVSGTLSTICKNLRTGQMYEGSFKFDGITRMSKEEIQQKRAAVQSMLAAERAAVPSTVPVGIGDSAFGAASVPVSVPELALDQVPTDWQDFWMRAQELIPVLDVRGQALLSQAMLDFANAVKMGNTALIEDKAYALQDTIWNVQG